jgi:hypothetical protein
MAAARAGAATPLDLWPAGDVGHARPTLLRAHPVLEDGRLQAGRLGRRIVSASLEAQRWWPVAAGVRLAGAAFLDLARTSDRLGASARGDADAGLGARLAVAGIQGFFALDLAMGLRDSATALSVTYHP